MDMDETPKNYLIVTNDGPYGNERPYNALRTALGLGKRSSIKVRVFLLGDGVQCAVTDSRSPRDTTMSRGC